VSGISSNPHPWLADHVIFFAFRWLALGASVAWAMAQEQLLSPVGIVLLVAAVLNIPATALAQRYVRVARRNPALMSLDILYAIILVVQSGGWDSPLIAFAYSSLVLPALLFGWPGGVMAGLSFVTMDQAALWAAGTPASERIDDGSWEIVGLAAMMVLPPLFGSLFPAAVSLLRRRVAANRRPSRRPLLPDDQPSRRARGVAPRFAPFEREATADAGRDLGEVAFALPAIRTRTAERSVEELRRVIFAPLPAAEMDLSAALDTLATRFGQHTGMATRVTTLGRTREVHFVHRQLLIRLVQEALLNIQQHAHAAAAVLTLRYDSSSVAILVQDDGVGLLDGTHERPGLHALRAMQYRLAECGGRLDVFETEGGGVTVRATMPLE
jgi:hypothetical protein